MKKITLSFDNGPTSAVTPFVFQALEARNLQAYFCVVGSQLTSAVEHIALAKEALLRGHRLVNHSLTHVTPLGEEPSAAHARAEIADMHELMNELLGDWGAPWFRPFGREGTLGPHVFSQAALDQFKAMNYSVMMWNSVPRDWVDTEAWVDRALKDIDRHEHTLVVLHDIDSGAMRHLPQFLDTLIGEGVVFTLELPNDCVPVRHGVAHSEILSGLVAQV